MAEAEATKQLAIPDTITVGDLAKKLDIPVTQLITELMKNGILATVNEKLDFDTAEIIVSDMDNNIELVREHQDAPVLANRREREFSEAAVGRPPVVAVMGHVDHGKTSLLDAIRGSDTAAGEAGGITQHISAYQITYSDRKITFLDTPGHEAFAALREHGAQLTDVAIIVIAADDGIKPQTKEAIRFARQAGVKMVVAINKIDKEGADPNRIKQQLADENLLIEEWGGDVITVPVSAKTKQGIDQLLETVLLVADVEELKAELDQSAEGIIIEAHMEQGKGAMATALVEHGELKRGQVIAAGGSFAKIRTLSTTAGEEIAAAGPSMPVVITGFKSLPGFGDTFKVFASEKEAKAAAASQAANRAAESLNMSSSELIAKINKQQEQQDLRVILRADVQGSLTSLRDSLQTLENKEVVVRVIGSGVGHVTESDVTMAAASDAIIYGFNVDLPVSVKRLAAREKVTVRVYNVIYELIDDVKERLTAMLSPEIIEHEVGRLVIKGVFRTTKSEIICGGEVTKGKIVPGVAAKVIRDKQEIAEVQVSKVQRQQQEVKEVFEGEMCGLQLSTGNQRILLEEGDRLELFTRETVARTL